MTLKRQSCKGLLRALYTNYLHHTLEKGVFSINPVAQNKAETNFFCIFLFLFRYFCKSNK